MNMREQVIEEILLDDLSLWAENPRDPMNPNMSDLEIIAKALGDNKKRWNLPETLKKMGEYYDKSDLPTVAKEGGKYRVYDGNRRVAILKYIQNCEKPEWASQIKDKDQLSHTASFPGGLRLTKIPCNICDIETALTNIVRKTKTWKPLAQDRFDEKYLKKEKSLFSKFEEETGLISKHEALNEGIIKDSILTEKKLNGIGFSLENEKLKSVYDRKFAKCILDKIVELKRDGEISSRKGKGYEEYKKYYLKEREKAIRAGTTGHEGYKKYQLEEPRVVARIGGGSWYEEYKAYQLKEPLIYWFDEFKEKIEPFDPNKAKDVDYLGKIKPFDPNKAKDVEYIKQDENDNQPTPTKPTAEEKMDLFGGGLSLEKGEVNNLYLAINEIYKNKKTRDICLPIIAMSLRLIVEVAARERTKEKVNNTYRKFIEKFKKSEGWSQVDENTSSLSKGCINILSTDVNFEAFLAKFAHGDIKASEHDVSQVSKIVGNILCWSHPKKS